MRYSILERTDHSIVRSLYAFELPGIRYLFGVTVNARSFCASFPVTLEREGRPTLLRHVGYEDDALFRNGLGCQRLSWA